MSDIKQFAKALLAGTHSPEALLAAFSAGPGQGLPVDPTNATPDDLERLRGSKIIPTRGVCSYLASDDVLTNDTINQMELSLERDYGIKSPWCITSMVSGTEEKGNLAVEYFYLERE